MAKFGIAVIEKLPEDKRISKVYVALINHYLKRNAKVEAERLAARALQLWPTDQQLIESFKKVFGYLPENVEGKVRSDSH